MENNTIGKEPSALEQVMSRFNDLLDDYREISHRTEKIKNRLMDETQPVDPECLKDSSPGDIVSKLRKFGDVFSNRNEEMRIYLNRLEEIV